MRGEKFNNFSIIFTFLGSPPHARGKAKENIPFDPDIRITPACAGKSPKCPLCPTLLGDHPRMRGEK